MGVQTEVIRHVAGTAVATTYQTGAIARMGEAVSRVLSRDARLREERELAVLLARARGVRGRRGVGRGPPGDWRWSMALAAVVVGVTAAIWFVAPERVVGDVEAPQWGVHAAAMSFDLHVPESRSLKAKRAAIRPIVDGLRHRFRISVAEVGHQDQWQRAEIAVAIVAESDGRVQTLLDGVERFVAAAPDVELLATETAWLEPTDAHDAAGKPPRRYPRTARVNEVVREALGDELERLSDPRLGLVTVTGVDVNADLRQATVYYSALGRADKRGTGVVPNSSRSNGVDAGCPRGRGAAPARRRSVARCG